MTGNLKRNTKGMIMNLKVEAKGDKIMKKLLLIVLIALVHFSCQKNTKDINLLKNEIIKTDKDFSNMSLKTGFQKAFLAYAADEVVILRQKNFPVVGKDNLVKLYNSRPEPKIVLTWEPVKADVSPDGILGYSYGKWVAAGKDGLGKEEKSYGVYVTVWKKQTDNTWKFVLDGGNDTPSPDK
jgi:ketosteroid isomerase-like protein